MNWGLQMVCREASWLCRKLARVASLELHPGCSSVLPREHVLVCLIGVTWFPSLQYFPKADKGALRLLWRLLAFDPAERPTAGAHACCSWETVVCPRPCCSGCVIRAKFRQRNPPHAHRQ